GMNPPARYTKGESARVVDGGARLLCDVANLLNGGTPLGGVLCGLTTTQLGQLASGVRAGAAPRQRPRRPCHPSARSTASTAPRERPRSMTDSRHDGFRRF